MPVLRDIPIQQYTIPNGETELVVETPSANLAGNWGKCQIILTNNYIDEAYPLTKEDDILTVELHLVKGNTPLPGVLTTFKGGQVLHFATGLPVPRIVGIQRATEHSGTIKVSATLTFYVDLEIGARVEYF